MGGEPSSHYSCVFAESDIFCVYNIYKNTFAFERRKMLIQKGTANRLLQKKNAGREKQWKLSKQSIRHALTVLRQSSIAEYIDEVYLYGSCARREQHIGSDVDLFVVLQNGFDAKQYHNALIQIMSAIQPDSFDLPQVDIKFETGHDWEKRRDLYYTNIKREGINIWGKQEIHTNI